ncbi:MAG: hypothetical protein QM541_11555 [Flavobacterium sp.]|nr:hypothetical protein [Flavobacterium sp.]
MLDLQQQYVAAKLTYVKTLDNLFENNKFSKTDAQKLIQIIINVCDLAIDEYSGTHENTELTTIEHKYHKLKAQELSIEDQALAKDMMQMMMKEQYGLDIDLSDVDNLDFREMKKRFTVAFDAAQAKHNGTSNGKSKNNIYQITIRKKPKWQPTK